jgi:hypothetical protein
LLHHALDFPRERGVDCEDEQGETEYVGSVLPGLVGCRLVQALEGEADGGDQESRAEETEKLPVLCCMRRPRLG